MKYINYGTLNLNLRIKKNYTTKLYKLYNNYTKIHNIKKKFNSYHHRLKFMETEVNRHLSSHDIILNIKNNKIITDWYHKTTFSGRYLSFYSNHPICHKVDIYSLVDRQLNYHIRQSTKRI